MFKSCNPSVYWNSFVSFKHFRCNFLFKFGLRRSFLIIIGIVFLFRIKLRTIEPLLHFDLHFCSKKKLWVRLFTIIGTFSKNLKCLLERFLVCWRKLKNLFKDTRVIWSSAGRILVSRSRSLAVSFLVLIKQTFIPQFICLLILSID